MWGREYPAITRLWEPAWAEFVPILQFDPELKSVVYSTNAIVDPRQVPAGRACQGPLPKRERRVEVYLPHRAQPGRHRQGQAAVAEPMEAATERIRRHVRRPHLQPQHRKPPTMALYTERLTAPMDAGTAARRRESEPLISEKREQASSTLGFIATSTLGRSPSVRMSWRRRAAGTKRRRPGFPARPGSRPGRCTGRSRSWRSPR